MGSDARDVVERLEAEFEDPIRVSGSMIFQPEDVRDAIVLIRRLRTELEEARKTIIQKHDHCPNCEYPVMPREGSGGR